MSAACHATHSCWPVVATRLLAAALLLPRTENLTPLQAPRCCFEVSSTETSSAPVAAASSLSGGVASAACCAETPGPLIGALLWLIALITTTPELRWNEALLVFWPTDALLLCLKAHRLQLYLRLRIASLAIVSALLVAGVLVQPLLTAVLIPILTCLALCHLPVWPAKQSKAAEAAS